MNGYKKNEFYFNPINDFKPISVSEIDKRIHAIQIRLPEEETLPVDSYRFDFSRVPSSNRPPVFKVNNFGVDRLKINFNEDEEEYEKINVLADIDLMKPFQYNGIKMDKDQKYQRVMRLTPSKEWPKITFLEDEKFKL